MEGYFVLLSLWASVAGQHEYWAFGVERGWNPGGMTAADRHRGQWQNAQLGYEDDQIFNFFHARDDWRHSEVVDHDSSERPARVKFLSQSKFEFKLLAPMFTFCSFGIVSGVDALFFPGLGTPTILYHAGMTNL